METGTLSKRERDVARCAATGMTTREIAEVLFINARTVESHLSSIYRKLGIANRAALAALAATGAFETTHEQHVSADLARLHGPTDFVGRRAELERITLAAAAAWLGTTRVVLVGGEPGAGKSSLLATAVRQLVTVDTGVPPRVAVGLCIEELRGPFGAITEAMSAYLAEPTGSLATVVGPDGGVLAGLLPSLAGRLPLVPADLDPAARPRLVSAALRHTVIHAARRRQTVLVIEDLHWADATGIAWLKSIATDPPDVPLLVLASFRSNEVVPSDPIFELLAETGASPSTDRIELAGLDIDEAIELARSFGDGAADRARIAELCRATSGNPLYLSSLLVGTTAEGTGGKLPSTVHEAVTQRMASFDAMTRGLLEVAAVIGLEFDLDLLVLSIGDRDGATPDSISAAVDRCILAGVLCETDVVESDLRFVHDVVRQSVLEKVPARRNARLHGLVGNALVVTGGDDPRTWPLAIDYLVRSPHADDHLLAGRTLCRLFETDIATLDLTDSVRRTESVLSVLPHGNRSDRIRLELLVHLIDLQNLRIDHEGHRQALLEAASLAERIGGPVDLANVMVHYQLLPVTGTIDEVVLARIDEAIAMLPRRGTEALRLRALLGGYAAYQRSLGGVGFRAADDGQAALVDARASGDESTVAAVLYNLSAALLGSPDAARMLELLNEYDRLQKSVTRPFDRHDGVRIAACAAIQLGDRAGFDRFRARLGVGAERSQSAFLAAMVVMWEVVDAMFDGRLDEAAAANDALFPLAVDDPNLLLGWLVQLVAIRVAQDRFDEVAPILDATVADHPEVPALAAFSGWARLESGDDDGAWAAVASLVNADFAEVRDDWTLAAVITWLTPVVIRRGQDRHSQLLLERLKPFSGQLVLVGSASLVIGAADRSLGMLSDRLDSKSDSLRYLESAESTERAAGALYEAASTRAELIRILHRSDQPADRKRGDALLGPLYEEARERGWLRLSRACATSL